MPMRKHEDILVFSRHKVLYTPQLEAKPEGNIRPATRGSVSSNYNKFDVKAARKIEDSQALPTTIIKIPNVQKGSHPTQKPVALMEYLIKTYTNEDMTVLDNCMGSGTTGVACVNLNRNFVGIELDPGYFQIAKNRIEKATLEQNLNKEL